MEVRARFAVMVQGSGFRVKIPIVFIVVPNLFYIFRIPQDDPEE